MWYLSFIFLILNLIQINCLECNQFDRNSNYVFGTKTNYNSSLNYFNSSNLNDLDLTKFVPDSCKLDKLYLLSRHSTRNPSLKSTKLFMNLYPNLKKCLSNEFKKDKERSSCEYYLFYHLAKWSFRYKLKEASQIVKIGDEITTEIGRRFGRVFGELFDYDNDEKNIIQIGITNETRTYHTMQAFVRGLEKPLMTSLTEKPCLHFHNLDGKDDKDNDNEFNDHGLIKGYKQSKEMKKLKKNITNRLKLKRLIKIKEIKQLYQLCAFDYELYNDPFWCNFITKDEFNTIEFFLDASTWFKMQLNLESDRKKSAIFFRDLRDFLISPKETKVFLEVLKVVLMNLKLFNSFDLESDFARSLKKNSNREFRLSKILPFNSNFAFIRYNCVNQISKKIVPKLLTLYQEQPVKVGNCSDFLCPLDQFLRFIYPIHSSLD